MPASFKRPMIVTILGVLNVVGGVFALAAAAFMAIGGLSSMKEGGAVMAVFGAVYGVVGIVQTATGVGLLGLKPWARSLQIGLAVIGLLGIPCGTIIGILILVYMLKPEVKLLFSGASPQELAPEEREMVERLGQSSGAMVALVAVLVALVGIAVVGIIAAIAIPSLLRARVSANEAATVGDLRTMVSAQAAYASANAGFPDKLECLARPVDCIPGYPPAAPTFLDASLTASDVRHGYRFRFVPGAPAGAEVRSQGKASPSSLTGWTYVAEPVNVNQTGVRAFCAEPSGIICSDLDGHLGAVVAGTCPADCRPLR
jgi:type II secretory pathway pseudopilin PulG